MYRARAVPRGLPAFAGVMWIVASAGPAIAQTPAASPPDPNPGNLTLTASVDAVSTYMFRGIRQHSTGIALWPAANLGVAVYSGKGGLKNVGVDIGTWNSLHTGDTGLNGPSGKLWFESDFYATLGLGFTGGTSLAAAYTAITSPNNSFTTVREIMFKVAVDDSSRLGKWAVRPYGFVALEFGTSPSVGQADGGSKAGRYLELGMAPGYTGSRASLSVPVKVGISLANYYELNTGTGAAPLFADHRLGYVSIAAIATLPVKSMPAAFGSWNVHGGLEVQTLGETTKAFNGGKGHRTIVSGGVGFSY
jgi:hypothetical protein